jgi:hypothetical protein
MFDSISESPCDKVAIDVDTGVEVERKMGIIVSFELFKGSRLLSTETEEACRGLASRKGGSAVGCR